MSVALTPFPVPARTHAKTALEPILPKQNASVSKTSGDIPDIILFSGPLDEIYTIKKTISLNVLFENNGFLISDDVFDMYGIGKTILEALEDYKITLVEYFELHESLPDSGSSKRFTLIKSYIAKK